MQTAADYVADLAAFIAASPSSYHAAAEAARRLDEAGFVRLEETDAWSAAEQRAYVVRDGAIIAWVAPEQAGPTTPFRILGAHTDSPGFKLKPKPTTGSHGWLQAGVEVYGGPLLNSWLDREARGSPVASSRPTVARSSCGPGRSCGSRSSRSTSTATRTTV